MERKMSILRSMAERCSKGMHTTRQGPDDGKPYPASRLAGLFRGSGPWIHRHSPVARTREIEVKTLLYQDLRPLRDLMSILFPFRIDLVNLKRAMSGLPYEPYTVKNLKPVQGISYKL